MNNANLNHNNNIQIIKNNNENIIQLKLDEKNPTQKLTIPIKNNNSKTNNINYLNDIYVPILKIKNQNNITRNIIINHIISPIMNHNSTLIGIPDYIINNNNSYFNLLILNIQLDDDTQPQYKVGYGIKSTNWNYPFNTIFNLNQKKKLKCVLYIIYYQAIQIMIILKNI